MEFYQFISALTELKKKMESIPWSKIPKDLNEDFLELHGKIESLIDKDSGLK